VRWLSGEGEARLRAVIAESSGEHMPELDLALNAGMRLGEMYTLAWEHVNLPRRVLTIPRSKNGEKRHVPLINIRTVQELMGHKDITMTLRYSHLAPKRTLGAVQQLSEPVMEIATGTKTSTEPKAPVQSETGYVQ